MANEERISVNRLAKLLEYDAENGRLTWLPRGREQFLSNRSHNIFKARFAGKAALNSRRPDGYLVGGVDGLSCYAHRVCSALLSGAWPVGEIDHINGDRSDNRAANLRDVGRSENTKNKQIGIRNKSGALGLFLEHTGNYRVRITDNYNTIELGRFADFDEALSVRKAAEREFSYHQNHGRKIEVMA